MIRIITVGKLKEKYFKDAADEYLKRLSKYTKIELIEVPDEDSEFYLLNDVPHGTIHMELLKSNTTGRYRNLWVYTPYGYETSGKNYPVMHILHGGGENETGWFWQGKLNYIADNLIAALKKPRQIQTPGKDSSNEIGDNEV